MTVKQPMNRSQARGHVTLAKGRLMALTGRMVGDRAMEVEGRIEQTVGRTQTAYGDLIRDAALGARHKAT